MGTTTTQQQTSQYNQPSLNSFNQMQPGISNTLGQYMNNPYSSGLFNLHLQQAMANANQLGQRGVSNIAQNLQSGGFGGGNLNAFQHSQLASAGRAQSALQSNAYQNQLLGAQQLQMQATQAAMGYRPLQTGQTSSQTQSGLGTWLPQLAGTALGIAGAGLTGGASPAAGAAGGSAGLNLSPGSFGQFGQMLGNNPFGGMAGTMAGAGGSPAFGTPTLGGGTPNFGYGMPNPFASMGGS